jgi:hypothetical protein
VRVEGGGRDEDIGVHELKGGLMEHIAIQDPGQTFGNINALVVLCRCRLTKHPPFDKVSVVDIVYLKMKGAPISAKATVSSAISKPYDDIEEIRSLCKSVRGLYNARAYWAEQAERGYATVVFLENHKPVSPPVQRLTKKGHRNNWIVLDTAGKWKEWPGL